MSIIEPKAKKIREEVEQLSTVDRELFFAARDEALKYMLRLLVFSKHTAYVDCQNRFGQTPIMWAAMSGKLKSMKLLMLFGAELGGIDHNKLTAISHLKMNGYPFASEVEDFFESIDIRKVELHDILGKDVRREIKINLILELVE